MTLLMINLVQEHGEMRILSALDRCEEKEQTAEVLRSTAHRAKGREWAYVHLDTDFESGFVRATKKLSSQANQAGSSFEAEGRLLYVAMTRARLGVHLPREIQKRSGLKKTTSEVLGKPIDQQVSPTERIPEVAQAPEAVSPFHSPNVSDSRELAALKRNLC